MQNGAATSGRASTASGSTLRPTSIRWELGLSGIAVFNVPSAQRGRKAASGLRALDLRPGRARLPAHAPAAARSVDEGRPAHAPTPPDTGSVSRRPARVSALLAHLLPVGVSTPQHRSGGARGRGARDFAGRRHPARWAAVRDPRRRSGPATAAPRSLLATGPADAGRLSRHPGATGQRTERLLQPEGP